MHVLLTSLLTGCTTGADLTTLVDSLQVVATLAEPYELGPGDTSQLETVLIDPTGEGFELMSWTCTFAGDGCLEAEGANGEVWDGLTRDLAPESTRHSSEYTLSPFLGEFLTDEPIPLVAHWSLACEPGLCPAFDEEDPDALRELLSDPPSMLETLPIDGVTLAVRWLYASTRADIADNPEVDCIADGGQEGEIVHTCTVQGDFGANAGVFGYATSGGWGGQSLGISEAGELSYSWFPDEEGAPAEVYVVAVDGKGGVGLWEGSVSAP